MILFWEECAYLDTKLANASHTLLIMEQVKLQEAITTAWYLMYHIQLVVMTRVPCTTSHLLYHARFLERSYWLQEVSSSTMQSSCKWLHEKVYDRLTNCRVGAFPLLKRLQQCRLVAIISDACGIAISATWWCNHMSCPRAHKNGQLE